MPQTRGWRTVAYCSVGTRSAVLARALADAGFDDLRNLEGSIFEWANRGHPLVRAGRPVHSVQPYGEPWSRLLHPALHAPPPVETAGPVDPDTD